MAAKKQVVSVGGHRITLTNLEKVLYPKTGTTKGDVLAYYAEVADYLILHARDRPATRKRWVNGVGTAKDPGEMFFQKNLDESTPRWVKRRSIEHKARTNEYPLVNDLATLTWLGQIAALEIHVPQWQFGRNGAQRNPDRLVLDLDPGEGVGLAECAEVARLARSILKDMGLEPVPVTSGSKGIHLYAALDGAQTSTQVSDVAHELARALEADHGDLVVSEMKKDARRGKVFVDWSQNNASKTTIVPYSLRGRLRPTAAVPRTWRELASKGLEQLDYEQVIARMKRRKDPMANLAAGRANAAATQQASVDRLTIYRGKRDSSKTTEPVPSGSARSTAGRSFVIQEHDARNLHHDFRLEHDGVLVSWALPKGVPIDTNNNHLAVQTEDHPLEYGTFEGRIPRGEYGAGSVIIWDSGTYELEKWREGEEIIVTLHGKDGGGLGEARKYALIHTGGEGKAEVNWLIHLMTSDRRVKKPGRSRKSLSRAEPIAPMLATPGTGQDLDTGDDWAFEMKWDGIRTIAYLPGDGGETRLLSRSGIDQAKTYPEIVIDLVRQGTVPAVVDGEIVALNKAGRPDFGLLQTRMGLTKRTAVRRAAESAPVQYLAFDLLEQDGRSLAREPYRDRRRALERLLRSAGGIQVPPAFDGDFDAAFASSHELGLEGVVAKKRDSAYRAGRRSRSWIKIKHHLTQEVVIAGWRPGNGRRSDTVGSLLMGIPDGEGLRYVGRVGTGFTDRGLADITRKLSRLERSTCPLHDVPTSDTSDAHWVTPKLVGEVEFAEWTGTGRLRQPSLRGWRPDKAPDEVGCES